MWHLLKTEWAFKKYFYLITLVFSGSYFFYKIIRSLDKWMHERHVEGDIIAFFLGFTFMMPLVEWIHKENCRNANPMRLLCKLPMAHWKLYTVRLLSGTTFLGSVLTLATATLLFFMRHQFGDQYASILAFHGLLVSSQILCLVIEDLIYKWTGTDAKRTCIYFTPVLLIFAVLILWKPGAPPNFTFTRIEIITLNLLPIVFLFTSAHLFQRRKSFLE